MSTFVAILGVLLVIAVLRDACETILLPRRSNRRFRVTRFYFINTWRPWARIGRYIKSPRTRENFLGYYGPISLLGLLVCWACFLIAGFGMIYWRMGASVANGSGWTRFASDLYLSGSTFFALGMADVIPRTPWGRVIVVAESGMGFGFLAIIIGYLPVIYQAFSRREVPISMLDARAGSPPSAGELLLRHADSHAFDALQEFFKDWERWSAEIMESHLSYAVLCFYRSQHDNQSWLAGVCTILDACAFVIAEVDGPCKRQAELTFAMTRHAVVDLTAIFVARRAQKPGINRLPPERLSRLRAGLRAAGFHLHETDASEQKLAEYRRLYEPFVQALAGYLCFQVPDWLPSQTAVDNWQTTAWGRSPGFWHDEIYRKPVEPGHPIDKPMSLAEQIIRTSLDW